MTQVSLKPTKDLVVGDLVKHPLTDLAAVIKEVREITYDKDRYDIFYEDASATFHVHGATLWRV